MLMFCMKKHHVKEFTQLESIRNTFNFLKNYNAFLTLHRAWS